MGGVGIVSGYGLTECPIIAMNSTRCAAEKLANTEGRVNPPEAVMRIVTLEGEEAGPGVEGEIRAFGPQLFKGYVDESLNEAAFDWFAENVRGFGYECRSVGLWPRLFSERAFAPVDVAVRSGKRSV